MEGTSTLNRRKYFPNLDGLRFFMALFIMVVHIEGIKNEHGGAAVESISYLEPLGYLDVCLFFVLSGFLITYFLITEKKDTGQINYKNYFRRRSLRIWPLHYLILILGFFVLPSLFGFINQSYAEDMHHHFWLNVVGCMLFLSPLVLITRGIPQTTGPVWSVGVEEIFYIVWPLFLKKTKNYFRFFVIIIIAVVLFRNGFLLLKHFLSPEIVNKPIMFGLQAVIARYTYSSMAIGGIGAYLIVQDKRKILWVLYRRDLQYFIYALTALLLVFKVYVQGVHILQFPSLHYEMYSILFCYIIINLADNPNSVVKINFKWINYLGRVSYGLYLYHPIMRILTLESVEKIFGKEISGWQMNLVYFSFAIVSTIIVAILSYEFFEKKFMKMGNKYRL